MFTFVSRDSIKRLLVFPDHFTRSGYRHITAEELAGNELNELSVIKVMNNQNAPS